MPKVQARSSASNRLGEWWRVPGAGVEFPPMKSLIVLLLLSTSIAAGQQRKPETLSVGFVPHHLGMSRSEVNTKLQNARYEVREDGVVMEKNAVGTNSIVGTIAFKNDRLSFINRSWLPHDINVHSFGQALYGVFRQLELQNRTNCLMATSQETNPNADLRSVTIRCLPGASYVDISIVRTSDGLDLVNIEEILREP